MGTEIPQFWLQVWPQASLPIAWITGSTKSPRTSEFLLVFVDKHNLGQPPLYFKYIASFEGLTLLFSKIFA